VSAAELVAVGKVSGQWLGESVASSRGAAALKWATARPQTFPHHASDPNASFDHYVALRESAGIVRPLPLVFLSEALQHGVQVLAGKAAEDGETCRRFAFTCATRLERALLHYGPVVGGRVRGRIFAAPDDAVHAIVPMSEDRFVAVQLLATLLPPLDTGPLAVERLAQEAANSPVCRRSGEWLTLSGRRRCLLYVRHRHLSSDWNGTETLT
jgi:hypothetical protein